MGSNKYVLLFLIFTFVACQSSQSEYEQLGLEEITIPELQEGYQSGAYSVADVTRAYLQRIEEVDQDGPELNSMIYINPNAIKRAEDLNREFENDEYRYT